MKVRVLMEGKLRTLVAKKNAYEWPWHEEKDVNVFVIETEGQHATIIYRESVNIGTSLHPNIIPAGAIREVTAYWNDQNHGERTLLTVDPNTRIA